MDLITLKAASETYGIKYASIYKAIRRGDLPAYRPGRILVDKADLHSWLVGTRIVPAKKRGRPRKTTVEGA